jgi:hypothetical protein
MSHDASSQLVRWSIANIASSILNHAGYVVESGNLRFAQASSFGRAATCVAMRLKMAWLPVYGLFEFPRLANCISR